MWDDGQYRQSYKFRVTPDHFRNAARPPIPGMRFSSIELRQIAISVVVLTLAFSMVLSGGLYGLLGGLQAAEAALLILASFIAVSTGFLLHELGHKKVAQGYGCFAEYRMSPQGLFLAIITSVFGFLFALPGAVVISGLINAEQNGKISVAGPAVNILIGAVCLVPLLLVDLPNLAFDILYIVAFVNGILAVFNLLPIPPLDGSKIFYWDKSVYVITMAMAIALTATVFLYV